MWHHFTRKWPFFNFSHFLREWVFKCISLLLLVFLHISHLLSSFSHIFFLRKKVKRENLLYQSKHLETWKFHLDRVLLPRYFRFSRKSPRCVFLENVHNFYGSLKFFQKVSYCYFSFPSLISTISNLNNGNSQTWSTTKSFSLHDVQPCIPSFSMCDVYLFLLVPPSSPSFWISFTWRTPQLYQKICGKLQHGKYNPKTKSI